jgi:hypothetical protein
MKTPIARLVPEPPAQNPVEVLDDLYRVLDDETADALRTARKTPRVKICWLTPISPIGEDGGINLYGYVDNDPVTQIDTYGLVAFNVSLGVGGTVFGLILGVHAEGNIGVSLDFSDLRNSRLFTNVGGDLMGGFGLYGGAGVGPTFSFSKCPQTSGFSPQIHVEGGVAVPPYPGGSGSVDFSPGSLSLGIGTKISEGLGAYLGLGGGVTGQLASPTYRDAQAFLGKGIRNILE